MPGASLVCYGSDDTRGARTLLEWSMAAYGHGPPLHLHRERTITFHVVQGTLALMYGDRTIMVSSTTPIEVSSQVPHSWWNPTAAPVQFQVGYFPHDIATFAQALADLTVGDGHWPCPATRATIALLARYGIKLAPD